MSEKELLKKLIRDAVKEAMGGLFGYLETLTESMDALRSAVLQDEEELPDEIDIARCLLKSLPPLPEGVTITIHTKEDI